MRRQRAGGLGEGTVIAAVLASSARPAGGVGTPAGPDKGGITAAGGGGAPRQRPVQKRKPKVVARNCPLAFRVSVSTPAIGCDGASTATSGPQM